MDVCVCVCVCTCESSWCWWVTFRWLARHLQLGVVGIFRPLVINPPKNLTAAPCPRMEMVVCLLGVLSESSFAFLGNQLQKRSDSVQSSKILLPRAATQFGCSTMRTGCCCFLFWLILDPFIFFFFYLFRAGRCRLSLHTNSKKKTNSWTVRSR